MITNLFRSIGGLTAGLFLTAAASAVPFSFQDISGTGAANNAADQVVVDVSGTGSTATFAFTFASGDAGIITAIGFGGTTAASVTNQGSPTILNGAGVSFTAAGNLPNLGGGGFTQLFGVERTNAGGVTNGLSNGETLSVTYNIAGGANAVVSAINAGTFNIGLHIQSLDNGDSQKAVLGGGPTPGPVPDSGTTIALLGAGLVLLAGFHRKLMR